MAMREETANAIEHFGEAVKQMFTNGRLATEVSPIALTQLSEALKELVEALAQEDLR